MKIAFVMDIVEFSIPLGIAYLIGVLDELDCEVGLFEIARNPKKTAEDIVRFAPGIVAYSVISGSQNRYLAFNAYLKKRLNFISLFGGPHITFFPEIIEEAGVDAICRGEGEPSLKDFVTRLMQDKNIPSDVLNFWVKKDGSIIKSPLRPLVKDLDSLPNPSRDIFYRRFPVLNRHRIKHFLAHRGCPYQCTYCFNKSFNELYRQNTPVYRSRDPRLVSKEIQLEKKKTQIGMIGFVDDNFVLDPRWLKDFCAVYKKEVALPFSINTRFDNLDEEKVRLLKSAGCALVYAGVESGNEFVRNQLLKRQMDLGAIERGAALLREYRIKFLTENLLGIPDEDFSACLETLEVNIRIRPDFANCSFFAPYPKLALTEYAIERGHFSGDFSSLQGNYYQELLIDRKDDLLGRKKTNLRCFFSFIVRYPQFLDFFNRWVFMLPVNWVFKKVGDLFDGYFMRKCLPYSMGFAETVRTAVDYLFRYRRGG